VCEAWDHDHWSIELPVDVPLDRASSDDYDALVLPGGVLNPDQLRLNPKAVEFATQFPGLVTSTLFANFVSKR
jgi:protease I